MTHSRTLLFSGLALLLRRLPAVLWTFVFSLAISILFTLRLHGQFSALLDHSLASASLIRGFDLPTAATVMLRLEDNVPGGASFSFSAFAVFLVLYFILVPGILFCYLTGQRARLSTLLRQGLLHFWRFVRITLLALITFAIVLGPLSSLNTRFAAFIDDRIVGRPAFLIETAATLLLFLIATLIRLYFDMVEVYTVQIGLALCPNGRPDRRIRRALRPAWRALRLHLTRLWGSFLLLSLLGAAGFLLLARTALHTLARPHVGALIVLSQLAVLLSIATRLWQRGAEVTLALDHPILNEDAIPPRTTTHFYPSTRVPPAPAPIPIPPAVAPPIVPSAIGNQVTPPGDLTPAQLPPSERGPRVDTASAIEPHTHPEPLAPIQTVYNIDPFTPLPAAPNPISSEEEEQLRNRPGDEPSSR